MIFGEVQTKILMAVVKSEGLKYSEAYPGGEIDDDLYNYHLQQLVKNGILRKTNGRYELTETGKSEVQMMDSVGEFQAQFRVSVMIYVTRNKNGEVLMSRRTRWPLKGDIVSPSGKIRRGETAILAAKRKLKVETGLEADFKMLGTLRSIRSTEGRLVEDTIYYVCRGEEPSGTLQEKSEFGEFFWSSWEKAEGFYRKNVGESEAQREILKRIKDNNDEQFCLEEELKLKSY